MSTTRVLVLFSIAVPTLTKAAQAGPVDLNQWTEESYSAVAGFNPGQWNVNAAGTSVFQSVNGQPTMFYSDFSAHNTQATGTIRVSPDFDDDYIGFALGFEPGDTTNAAADYLLVDWKRRSQFFDFGSPSHRTPGSVAPLGLAVSHVTGIPTADEFWGHDDFSQNPAGGLEELARGNTLGSTGWTFNRDYEFRFVFLPNRLQVLVDDTLELDVQGDFANGRLTFYNFSQARVTYSAFESDPADESDLSGVPEPASMTLLGVGVFGSLLAYSIRRRGGTSA